MREIEYMKFSDREFKSASESVKEKIARGREIQAEWAGLPVGERVRHIQRIQRFIAENSATIAETISLENGKVPVDSLATEVLPAALEVRYYSRMAKRFLKPRKIKSSSLLVAHKRSRIYRKPFGVIGIISPWNYPFGIPFPEIIMALLAGNAVILKTAGNMPKVTQVLLDCIGRAELPEGLFQSINLPGRIAGDRLLEGGIDKLFFTGSVESGKYLMKKASETLTPLVLELGGNDAMIVCKDADLDRAAAGAIWGGFSSTGQSCGGVERLYVAEEIFEEFLNMLKTRVAAINTQTDNPYACELGSMATAKQREHVRRHVEDALQKGAVIAARSNIPDDPTKFYYPATILINVNHEMDLMKEETFGPVIGVMPFKTEDEAIRLANDSHLGLTGSVWSKNRRKAIRIGRQINAGAITINDHLMSHGLPETPWGGFKQSGIGRTHGRLGFDEMTQPQVVVDDILSFTKNNLWWAPYNRQQFESLQGLINTFKGSGFKKRVYGFRAFLKIIGRMF